MLPGTNCNTGSTLIVGVDSHLGSALRASLQATGRRVAGTTRRRDRVGAGSVFLDLNDPCNVDLQLEGIQTAVICAAVTSIAECEQSPKTSARINVESTSKLARRLVDAGVHTVFVSSNAVFDGGLPFPRVTDETRPLSEYGRQKRRSEERLLGMGGAVSIVRFSKILPADAPLFCKWAAELHEGRVIEPIEDAYLSPLSLPFAIAVLERVISLGTRGVIQASANRDISYAEVGDYLARHIGADAALVQPRASASVGATQFPRNTSMDTTTLQPLGLEAPDPYSALDHLELSGVAASPMRLAASDAAAVAFEARNVVTRPCNI